MIQIVCVPILKNDYTWMVRDKSSKLTGIVDPGHVDSILSEADRRGWTITELSNTRWHDDHIARSGAIMAVADATLIAPDAEKRKIPMIDVGVADRSRFTFKTHEVQVIGVPGHTLGYVAYFIPDMPAAFVGDTLFVIRCGSLFEATPEQMFTPLQRLAMLTPKTLVYCAHEYTQLNAAFAFANAPAEAGLVARASQVAVARAKGLPTVPTTINIELTMNPFLRAGSVERFAALRRARDTYKPGGVLGAMHEIGAALGAPQ